MCLCPARGRRIARCGVADEVLPAHCHAAEIARQPSCSARRMAGILHLDRWQSRVNAALRVEGRARTDGSKARGANGVPRPTRGSNPLRSAASSSAAERARGTRSGRHAACAPHGAADGARRTRGHADERAFDHDDDVGPCSFTRDAKVQPIGRPGGRAGHREVTTLLLPERG